MRKLIWTVLGLAVLSLPLATAVSRGQDETPDKPATEESATGEPAAGEPAAEEATPPAAPPRKEADFDEEMPAAPRRASLRRDTPVAPELTSTLSPPTTTPEMWLYEQERLRYNDPKQAVRRNAEYRFAQRARRVESMNWYGYSKSRPIASPNPYYEMYSPGWVGNTAFPYEWSGVGATTIVVGPRAFAAPGY